MSRKNRGKMWILNEIRLSGFSNITETKLPYQCLLYDVLDSIKHPSQELKSCIAQIRRETDHDKQNELKVKLLPVFCFSGTFSERNDTFMTLKTLSITRPYMESWGVLWGFREGLT